MQRHRHLQAKVSQTSFYSSKAKAYDTIFYHIRRNLETQNYYHEMSSVTPVRATKPALPRKHTLRRSLPHRQSWIDRTEERAASLIIIHGEGV